MKTFFSSSPIQMYHVLAAVRIIVGMLILYHGFEIFDQQVIQRYLTWDIFKNPSGKALVYVGKSGELISGILLVLGLFTRMGALLLMGTLSYITFFIGQGRIWYEDQHPFLFVLFGVLFLFAGPGSWSLDEKLFGKTNSGKL
jgi:putative oxidoreductase